MEKKEKYQTSFSVNEDILEIVLTGELIDGALEGLQNKITDIIDANGAKNVLFDARAINGRISITDSYTAVRLPHPDMGKRTTAVVDRPERAEIQSFLETTALNAGWSHKWFTDIDKARAWLKASKKM